MKKDYLKQLLHLLKRHGFRQSSPIERDDSGRLNGIISDRQSKKHFLKTATGKNSYQYKSLCRESQITRYLYARTKKTEISHNGYDLCVPNVTKIIDQDDIFCLITRYIEGKKLLNEHFKTQADILLTTLELVAKLSEKTHMSTIQPYLKSYTKEALLLSLPIRFIKATTLSPFVFPGLVRALLKTLPLLSSDVCKYGLVHPDINASNIIFHKDAIYLTDWEEAGWGISTYNTITPLCVHWQNQKIRDTLFDRLQDGERKKITIPLLAFRTLMLFNQRMEGENKKRKRDFMLLKFLETV